jgi:hypothetical protein
MSEPQTESVKLTAGIDLLRRTGAQTFRTGYSDPDDGDPIVWYAIAQWVDNRAEAAAALDPVTATLRLCERVIDGGECQHCHLPTIFVPDSDTELLDKLGCVYAWDPELSTFRRGCEGD